MQLIPFIAIRHLRARLRSTLLIVAGVAVGVAVMSTMASLLRGLQTQFIENLVETMPNITVEGTEVGGQRRYLAVPTAPNTAVGLSRRPPPEQEEGISNYRQVIRQVEEVPGVVAAAPTLAGPALLGYGTRIQPVSLTGVLPQQQARAVAWTSRLRQQRSPLENSTTGAVIGIELAKNLGIPAGGRITLTSGPDRRQRLRVVALYQSGLRPIDETAVFVNLSLAQSLLDRPSEVSTIAVRVRDIRAAPQVAQQISAATGLRARSWQELSTTFFSVFRLQNTVTAVMVMFVVIISGFGIANGLVTLILEKQRDIGILKALGVSASRVALIFLLEGLLMGLLGAGIGIGLARVSIGYLDRLPLQGQGELSTASTFTMLRTPAVYLLPALIAVTVSTLASLLPVRRAAKYDPVEIIRSAR